VRRFVVMFCFTVQNDPRGKQDDILKFSVRIVGGKAADIGQYPWLVNLGYTQVTHF
jgi:hypothetical protein